MSEERPPGSRPPRSRPPRDLRSWRIAAALSTAGLTLALSVAIGVGVGYLIDRRFGTNYWVIIFTLVGAVAGFKQLIRIVIQSGREQERIDREQREQRDGATE